MQKETLKQDELGVSSVTRELWSGTALSELYCSPFHFIRFILGFSSLQQYTESDAQQKKIFV
jgi:hypothetical protein